MSETPDIPDEDDEIPAEIARCRGGRPLWDEHYPPCPDAWNNERVRALLNGIVREQAYDRLPILADALEEAGCEDVLLLRHCRECAEHDSTCWVLRACWANMETLEWEVAPSVVQQRAVEAIAESVRRAQQRQRYADERRTGIRLFNLINLILLTFLAAVMIAFLGYFTRTSSTPAIKPQPSQPSGSRPTPRVSNVPKSTHR